MIILYVIAHKIEQYKLSLVKTTIKYKMVLIYSKADNKFYTQITQTPKSKTHFLVEDLEWKEICMDQAIECLFKFGDIVKFHGDYWKIIHNDDHPPNTPLPPYEPKIKLVGSNIECHYRIRLLVDKNTMNHKMDDNKTSIVNQTLLEGLTKKDSDNIKSMAFNTNRYNFIIFMLSRFDSTKHTSRSWKDVNFNSEADPALVSLPYVKELIDDIKIPQDRIPEIGYNMKWSKLSRLQLRFIKIDPFSFIMENWQLFRFDKADYIDKVNRVNTPDETRLKAWINSLVHETNQFYIPKKQLEIKYEEEKYIIFKKKPRHLLSCDILVRKTIHGEKYYTTEILMNIERELGDTMIELFHSNELSLGLSIDQINDDIREFENDIDINGNPRFTLNEKQRQAVINCLTKRLSITNGFPGTGKTTIMECVMYIRAKHNKLDNMSISAPTGMAFKNISDKLHYIKVGDKTHTINLSASGTTHKAVYNDFPRVYATEKKQSSISNLIRHDWNQEDRDESISNIDTCIIDEVSMLDIYLFSNILKWCKAFNSQLILIGDENQLASIGPGCILHSIISCRVFNNNIVKLDQICRQSGGALLTGILRMANGKLLRQSNFDNDTLVFRYMRRYSIGSKINPKKLEDLFTENGLTCENTKVLCYHTDNTKPINTDALNIILQNMFNPDGTPILSPTGGGILFRTGDRVILQKNMDQTDIHGVDGYHPNGDEAEIIRFYSDTVNIKYMTGSIIEISINTLYDKYKLSYALSVYKSQGGQYPNIVFIISNNTYGLDKSMIFTGISRAQKRCFIISDMVDFIDIQKINRQKPSIFMKELNEYDIE
jgi:hypothetical protein